MAWPPNPNSSNQQSPDNRARPAQPPTGQEWRLLEKTLLASIDEQRKARRWGIFFKLLTFVYLVFIVLIMGRGCSTATTNINPTLKSDHLAIVNVEGVISSDMPANSSDISAALTDAFENESAKAVALTINSPGGSPVQSDEVWQTMRALKEKYPDKKLYAVVGDIGASGAYYIASASDEIWVNSSSLIGSIGVIMANYNAEGLMDKIGVKDRTMTAGEYKDILSMSRPISDEERAHVQATLDAVHQDFIDAVVAGRGDRLKNPEENKLFSGLYWTGKQSVALGLADKIGGIYQLKKELGLEHTVDYTPVDPMRELFDRFGVQFGKGVGAGLDSSIRSSLSETPSLR